MPAWLEVFGRLHPLLLHLPAGLLIALGLFEGVAVLRRGPPAPRLLVVVAAAGAVITAASGWVLHEEPDYSGSTLTWHMRLGIATASGAAITALLHGLGRVVAYRIALLTTLAVLVPAGHFGSTMTHGAGFVTEPLRDEEPEPAPVAPPAVEPAEPAAPVASYVEHVAPLFAARCTSCHGEKKKKSGLRLDAPEWILKGGRGGDALIAGSPEESELTIRLRLPMSDEDHMPPEHKAQPAEAEIALLETWIAAGAPFEGTFALPGGVALPSLPAAPAGAPELMPAPEAALAALRARLVHVQPVAAGTEELWIDFAAPAEQMDDAAVQSLLRPLLDHVAELNLSRTRISDAALKQIAEMPRLRRLDLRATAVTDAGLARLKGHDALVELVLAQTKVSDAAGETLQSLPALEKVWLWGSGMSLEGVTSLRAARPELRVDAGDAPAAAPLEAEGALTFTSDAPPPDAAPVPASLQIVNTICPVTGDPVNPKYSIVFEGRVVGFCCPNCPKEFWADPEQYRVKLP